MMQLKRSFLKNRTAIIVAIMAVGLAFVFAGPVYAQTLPTDGSTGLVFISAGLAVGLACIGSGIAIYGATTGGSALMAERPEMSIWVLLFAGLGEGLAIFGFVIAILIISKI